MIDKNDILFKDFEAVKQIAIVPTMLDVVCRITGMGFAAVARVTQDRWIACSVKDDVNFGLAEGGELKIETTICNEIRDSGVGVVIDHVDLDEHFKNHHTPKMYGLQSYISYPIILKDGTFFGTLCAIDSKPASVNRPEVLGTFKLFSELLAFHLESMDLMDRSEGALRESNKQLTYTSAENDLYKQISNHNIQEQVRKISVLSDMLVSKSSSAGKDKIEETAYKINAVSRELNGMMQHVTKLSEIKSPVEFFESIDMNEVVSDVCNQLAHNFHNKGIDVKRSTLPAVSGIPAQLKELFFQLLNHTLIFSENNATTSINISSKEPSPNQIKSLLLEEQGIAYSEIVVEQIGNGVIDNDLRNIFDIFVHLSEKQADVRYGKGLAYSRKIAQNHGGIITVQSTPGAGLSFSVILPLQHNTVSLGNYAKP